MSIVLGVTGGDPEILRRDQIVQQSLNDRTSDRDLCERVLPLIELHPPPTAAATLESGECSHSEREEFD